MRTYVLSRAGYEAAIDAAVKLQGQGYVATVKPTLTGTLLETNADSATVQEALR